MIWLYLFKFKDWGFDEAWTLSPRAIRRWRLVGIGVNVFWIGYLMYLFWVHPFFAAVAWGAALSVGVFAAQTHRGRRYVATALGIYFVILLAAHTGEAYVSPAPLARAEVTMLSGETVRGSLVTTDGGSWYVATSKGHFRMIPASQVQTADVHSVKRKHQPRPVLKVVWQRVRGWF